MSWRERSAVSKNVIGQRGNRWYFDTGAVNVTLLQGTSTRKLLRCTVKRERMSFVLLSPSHSLSQRSSFDWFTGQTNYSELGKIYTRIFVPLDWSNVEKLDFNFNTDVKYLIKVCNMLVNDLKTCVLIN